METKLTQAVPAKKTSFLRSDAAQRFLAFGALILLFILAGVAEQLLVDSPLRPIFLSFSVQAHLTEAAQGIISVKRLVHAATIILLPLFLAVRAVERHVDAVRMAARARRVVTIEIADNGPGIQDAIKLRLFEPYFSTKESGTGLGLSIVRKTVEEQGGRLEVTSSPGAGTRITVDLPAFAEPEGPGEPRSGTGAGEPEAPATV